MRCAIYTDLWLVEWHRFDQLLSDGAYVLYDLILRVECGKLFFFLPLQEKRKGNEAFCISSDMNFPSRLAYQSNRFAAMKYYWWSLFFFELRFLKH